jgi:hypothetical protein
MSIQITTAKKTVHNQIKCLIFGNSGTGKTQFSTGFDKGIVMDFESGLASASNPDIAAINCKTARDFTESLIAIEESGDAYDTVIVDSLTSYGEKVWIALKSIYNDPSMGMRLWAEYDSTARTKVDELLGIDKDIVVTMLEENIIENMVSRQNIAFKAKKYTSTIPSLFDLVGHMGFNEEGKRVIDFKGNDQRVGKNRYSNIGLPDIITEDDELFSADAIFKFIRERMQ